MLVDDDLIYDTGADNMTEEGDLIVRLFLPHPDHADAARPPDSPARWARPQRCAPIPAGSSVTSSRRSRSAVDLHHRVGRGQLPPAAPPPEFNPGYDIKNDRAAAGAAAITSASSIASERVCARADLDLQRAAAAGWSCSAPAT